MIDFSEILWKRRMGLGIIWDVVCFPLGSGFFTVIWFSRVNRWAFFFFGGVLVGCLIFDWWEWFSVGLMIYPLLLICVSCLLIRVFCFIFQSRELSVWMRPQERRGNFLLTQSNTLWCAHCLHLPPFLGIFSQQFENVFISTLGNLCPT